MFYTNKINNTRTKRTNDHLQQSSLISFVCLMIKVSWLHGWIVFNFLDQKPITRNDTRSKVAKLGGARLAKGGPLDGAESSFRLLCHSSGSRLIRFITARFVMIGQRAQANC